MKQPYWSTAIAKKENVRIFMFSVKYVYNVCLK